jgi:hypothetical protein
MSEKTYSATLKRGDHEIVIADDSTEAITYIHEHAGEGWTLHVDVEGGVHRRVDLSGSVVIAVSPHGLSVQGYTPHRYTVPELTQVHDEVWPEADT